jgi:hypothetical protein
LTSIKDVIGCFGHCRVHGEVRFAKKTNQGKEEIMLMKGFGALLCSAFLISIQAFAQEDYTQFKSDGAVQALGSFVTDTTNSGVHQTATNSGACSRAIGTTSIGTTASR